MLYCPIYFELGSLKSYSKIEIGTIIEFYFIYNALTKEGICILQTMAKTNHT